MSGLERVEVGAWSWEIPPAPHSQAARTAAIDAEVLDLQAHAGMWKLVDLLPGRGSSGSTYRTRGCEVKTRHRKGQGMTETWARWPAGKGDA